MKRKLVSVAARYLGDTLLMPVIRGILFCGIGKVSVALWFILRQAYWKARLGAMGKDANIYPTVVIYSPEKVRVGARVSMAEFVHIWGGGGITIGDDVMIGSHSVITSQTHDASALVFRETSQMLPVVIENNVWIGSSSIILPGVRVGKGAVVGAGSVVTRDVLPRTLVAGIPARTVRQLEGER